MCENWKQECKKGFLAPDQVSKELLRRNNQICNNLQHIRYLPLSLSLSLTNVLSLPLFLHFTPIYLCINVSIYLYIYLFNINVSIYRCQLIFSHLCSIPTYQALGITTSVFMIHRASIKYILSHSLSWFLLKNVFCTLTTINNSVNCYVTTLPCHFFCIWNWI